MPDIEYTVLNGVRKKLKDIGDGTHAEVVYVANAAGGSSGSGASIEKQIIPGVDSSAPSVTIYQNWDLSVTPPTVSYVNQSGATVTLAGTFVPDADTTGATAAKQDQQTALLQTVAGVTKGSGAADASTQRVTLATDGPVVTAIGTPTDAAAAADGTGNYGVIAAIKRGLLNWATLLARIPAAVATDAVLQAVRDRLPATMLTPGLLPVDTLGTPGTPRVQATSATPAGITLTATCRRVSMYATAGTWYAISGAATATSHYIGAGERLDFDVPAGTTISVLQETAAGSVRITELA